MSKICSRYDRIPALFRAWARTAAPNAFRTSGTSSANADSCIRVNSLSAPALPSAEERWVMTPSTRRALPDPIASIAATHAPGDPGPSQPHPLLHQGHPEQANALSPQRPGDGDRPVPVRIRLDDREDRGRRGKEGADDPEIVAQCREVDFRHGGACQTDAPCDRDRLCFLLENLFNPPSHKKP